MTSIAKLIQDTLLACDNLRTRCDAAWDESKHPRAEDGKFGAGGGKFSEHQEAMHEHLTKSGWSPASEEHFSSNAAAAQEGLAHRKVESKNGSPSYGGYDKGAQTYVHPDKPGEAIGTGSHNPSHGSNWSHTKTILAGPVLSKPGAPLTQFLGGTRGKSGTGPDTLKAHLKAEGGAAEWSGKSARQQKGGTFGT